MKINHAISITCILVLTASLSFAQKNQRTPHDPMYDPLHDPHDLTVEGDEANLLVDAGDLVELKEMVAELEMALSINMDIQCSIRVKEWERQAELAMWPVRDTSDKL